MNPEVAAQMATGAARVCGADYAVSTTGVAGPDPADGQPVGTVFIGVHARAAARCSNVTTTAIALRFARRPPRMRLRCWLARYGERLRAL